MRYLILGTGVYCLALLPCWFLLWCLNDVDLTGCLWGWLASLALSFFGWLFYRQRPYQAMQQKQIMAWTSLLWFTSAGLSAWFMYLMCPDLRLVDAVFASVSGITTTGAEVLANLDQWPLSLRFFRLWLQFLGGLGLMVLLLGVLPLLSSQSTAGLGLKSDMPGPSRAKILGLKQFQVLGYAWAIYLGLMVVSSGSLYGLGLLWYESIGESLSLVSTGGYGLYQDGLAHYHKSYVLELALIVIILSSISFISHVKALISRNWNVYSQDQEFTDAWKLLLGACLIGLLGSEVLNIQTFRQVLFQLVSYFSTSGHTFGDVNTGNTLLMFMGLGLCVLGTSTASTAGGVKLVRFRQCLLATRQAMQLFFHPRLMLTHQEPDQSLHGSSFRQSFMLVYGFISLWCLVLWVSVLWLLVMGSSLSDAWLMAVACLTNTGATAWPLTVAYADCPSVTKWTLCALMMIGRLELYPLLVGFEMIRQHRSWSGIPNSQ